MKRDDEQGQDGIFGRGLPGTGGDARIAEDGDDVEGHRRIRSGEPDGLRRDVGPDGLRRDDQDVEGHRVGPWRDAGPDGLYTGGPKTQGEFTRRGPGENPHGER